jgi:hypothetical protein
LNINHLLSRVVLYAISPDNKNPRFAGVLSLFRTRTGDRLLTIEVSVERATVEIDV